MKLVTTARQLRDALRCLRAVIERHNTYPILSSVHFSGATLSVTDLDMELSMKVAAVEASGEAAIDFFRLAALVNAIPLDSVVTITADKDRATISFGASRYDLPHSPPDSYPVTKFVGKASISLANTGWQKALRFVTPMICSEETRYYLNGACFSRDMDGNAVMVATDGHRMGVHPHSLGKTDLLVGDILPAKAVRLLGKLPAADKVEVGDGRHRYRWSGMTLTTKLIEGTFPDWQRVLPKETKFSITVKRDEALQCVRRLATLRSDTHYVTLAFQGERAVLTTFLSDMGDVTGVEHLASCATTGADTEQLVTMNAHYLRSLLSNMAGNDHVRLSFIDAGSPIRVTIPGDKAFAVLMPARGSHDEFALQTLREASSAEPQKAAA